PRGHAGARPLHRGDAVPDRPALHVRRRGALRRRSGRRAHDQRPHDPPRPARAGRRMKGSPMDSNKPDPAGKPDPADLPDRADVVVVGARVAGAATAMLLARHGLDVVVLDRAPEGTDTLSTHALMRAGVLQLHRWGVLDR